jgi:carboxyl-terminal processing protease
MRSTNSHKSTLTRFRVSSFPFVDRVLVLVLFLLLLAAAPSAFGQQSITPPPAAPTVALADKSEQSEASKRQESFQIVWQTVNDFFYDPKFGGVDWAAVRERYEPQVASLNNDRQFHLLMQEMLNELHQSHFMVVPREAIPKIRKTRERAGKQADDLDEELGEDLEPEEPLDTLSYKLTDRLLTGIGIDVRVLGGSAVVTRVEPGSSAARAGLRPGFVIKKVDSRSLDSVISEIERHPQWGAIIRPELPVFLVAGFINGEEASPVRLGYLDARNRLRTISIKRERLKGEMSPAIGNLPAMYVEFESRFLAGGVGYIRFSAFVPSLMEKLCGAFRTMKDAPGIILDLRGNQGGLLGMVGGLTGLLENETTFMGTMQMRRGRLPLFGFPQSAPYSGPLVILVDGSTQSAGEMFASGLKEAGRATLVGVKSAGNTLPSEIKKLPTGAIFQYGFANYETQSGYRLEGQGVSPHITVELSRRGLLKGGDPQLSMALSVLQDEIRWGRPGEVKADDIPPPLTTRAVSPSVVAPAVVEMPQPPTTRIVVDGSSPPPPAPPPPYAVVTAKPKPINGQPTVASILDRYLEASGGRSALEKVTNRVGIGTVEMTSIGMTGTVEIVEQSPNRSSVIINAPGLGVMQKTFDGSRGWLQDPLQGTIRFTGVGLEMIKESAVFNKPVKLKELFPSAVLMGKEKLAGKDVYVVRMGFEKWYFDAEGGLLLRKGNTYYEDYREVDGIKLPFRLRDEVLAGSGIIYQLAEIKHNVKIDETKFTAYPSCFTRP